MARAFVLRLVLTALAFGCAVSSALQVSGVIAGSHFPLQLTHRRTELYQVKPLAQRPLPAPLHAGDLIDVRQLSPAARAVLFSGHDVPPGTRLSIPVLRAGRPLTLSVPAVPDSASTLARLQSVFFLLATLLISLLTLWRGRDWAAWGLAALFLALFVKWGILDVPAAPPQVLWMNQLSVLLRIVVDFPALFVVADALVGASLPARWRRRSRLTMSAVTLGILVLVELQIIPLFNLGRDLIGSGATVVIKMLFVCGMLTILLMLGAGYRHAPHEQRLRVRWVLWSTAVLIASNILLLALPSARYPYVTQLSTALQTLALIGYLYAVLRTRLIDVGFVIDRALVFGLLTALVFGTFSILEQALHQFAISDRVGWALQAVAALVLALVLSPLHRRLESWIERAFFRAQRLALLALERFARECPYVEHETHLLEMAIEQLHRQCGAVSLYERVGDGYRRRAASDESWPAGIDVDDPVFVALRATHAPVALAAQGNRVGTEGMAFPMTVAESLLGALICRPRDGEQFAPEVREALANVAHHLGMAITGLRHREHARLVADVAAGRIDPEAARSRAIALVGGEPSPVSLGAAR
jgi:hypothetical protein